MSERKKYSENDAKQQRKVDEDLNLYKKEYHWVSSVRISLVSTLVNSMKLKTQRYPKLSN